MFKKSFSNLKSKSPTSCLVPSYSEILMNYLLQQQAFVWVIDLFKERNRTIKCIIIGEAPLSYMGYFYNPVNEQDTSFLRFKDVAIATKKCISSKIEMINVLIDYEILMIDLYPLALPSNCYKNPNFYDPKELYDYWDGLLTKVKPYINAQNVKIVLRYKKHQRDKDAPTFISKFNNNVPGCLGSKNMQIDKSQFKKLFQS
jgi:hypothetical protein